MSAFKDSGESPAVGWRRVLRLGGILAAAFVLAGCTVYDTGYRGSRYYGYDGPYLYSNYYYGYWSGPIVVERRGHVHRKRPHHVRPAARPRPPGYSRPDKRRQAYPVRPHRSGAATVRPHHREARPWDGARPSRPMRAPGSPGVSRQRR